jgi:Acetyl-coenzyme A transporter 1
MLVVVSTVLNSFARFVLSSQASHTPGLKDLQHVSHSTVQFVGISAFHTQIADPLIGGTYMTVIALFSQEIFVAKTRVPDACHASFQLLNTVSNLGGTWPRYFVLRGKGLST